MCTIVEASVPAGQFALRETLRTVPDARFEAVRTVPRGPDEVMPLLWNAGGDPAAVSDALEADPSTRAVTELTRFRDASMYRVAWTTPVRVVTALLGGDRATIANAVANDETWTFRVWCGTRDVVASIVENCARHGVDLRIERICPMVDSPRSDDSTLTAEQRRTVATALERGYYAVPRETTLTELSAELGVSHQALSERLRRGHKRLIESTLGMGNGPDSE